MVWLAVTCTLWAIAGCGPEPPPGSRSPASPGELPAPPSATAGAGSERRDGTDRGRPGGEPQYLPRVELELGGRRIAVEVARTPEQRQRGLMFRTDLGPDDGMLFVFPSAQPQHFWMRNTPSPLSIAFIDADGVIVEILDMEPFDEVGVRSRRPVPLALEMPRGWFARNGIAPGERVRGLERLPQPR
ncbi:MAG: hypothetical protein KatS3mg102_2377 [Planctomycetota bacterium]|nr:MAG: hypothetical protein KatS3mg102_2377 [Planctomycetota bacterium]